MSATPPPAEPNDPKEAAKKELTNTVIWAVLALAFAIGIGYYGTTVEPEKKNFYFIAGGIAAIVAVYNGYLGYTLYEKTKQPPAAPK